MPRKLRILLIAGPHSGVGKTFVTTGLAKALRAKGEHVEVFREGPELQPCCLAQDPLYIASGTCPSSLDSWLLSPGHIQQYLADRCSSECTVALIDSSLGLWDAAAGVEDPQYCAAQVAKTLGASTVLVIDQCASTNSAVALLRGYVGFDPGLEICGVICNKAGQSISRTSLQAAAASAGLDTYILGALPKVDFTPSQAEGFVEMAAAFVNSYTDVDELLRLTASRMQTLPPASTSIPHSPSEPRPRIAVAEDEVFHSSYPENPALLSLAGAEVVYFSPLRDGSLPPNISAIILGAGSLSSHGPVLAANIPMLTAVRVFAQHGGLVYAESAGLSYLASSVQLVDGGVCKMAGVFPFCAAISSSKPRTGYVELVPLQPGYCSLLPSDSAPPLSVGGRSSDRSSDRSSHASTTGGRSSNSLRGWYQGSVEILEAPRQHGQQQQQQPQPPAGQALGQGQLGPSWPRQQQKQQKQKQKQLCHIDVNRSQAAVSTSGYQPAFKATIVESSGTSVSYGSGVNEASGQRSEPWSMGLCSETVLASPVHLHFGTIPHLLRLWVARCNQLNVASINAATHKATLEAVVACQEQQRDLEVWESRLHDMQQHLLIHEPSECGISTSMQPNPLRQEVSEGCLSNASAAASITSRGESNPGWSHPTHIPIPSQRMLSSSSSSPNLNNSQQLMFEDRQRQVPYSPSFMSLDLAVRQSDAMEHSRSHGVSHRQSMQELDHSKHQGTMHNPNFKYSSDNLCSKTWSSDVIEEGTGGKQGSGEQAVSLKKEQKRKKNKNETQDKPDAKREGGKRLLGGGLSLNAEPKKDASKRLLGGGHRRTPSTEKFPPPPPLDLPSANGRTHAKLIGLSVPLRLSTSTASLPGGSEAALKAPGPRSESSKSGGGGGEGSTAPSAAVGSTAAAIPPLPPTHPLSPMPRAPPRAPGGTPPGHAGPGASPANSNGTSPSQSQGHGANGSTLSPAATEVSAAPRDSQGMGHGVNGSVLSPAAPGAAAAPRDSRDCHETTRNDSELVSRDGLNHERGSPFQDSPTTTTNDYDSAEASRPLSTDLPVPLSRPISGPLSCPVSWSSDPMDSPHHSSQGSLDLEQRQARAHALAEERLQALKLQQQMRQAGGQAGGIGTRQVGGHAGQHLIHGAGPASGEGLPPLPGDAGARGRRSQSPWGGALPLPSDAGAGGRRSEPGWDGLPPLPSDAGAGGRRSQSGWGGPVQPQQGHDTSGRLSITYRRLNDSNTTLGSDEGEGEEDGETDALWDTLQPYPYRQGGSGGAADRVGAVRKSIQVPSTRNPQHTAPLRGSFQGPAMHASASTGHLARPGPSLGLQGGRQCSIVSFSTGATEALLALGLAQRISGVSDDHSNSLVGEALRDVPVLCKNRVRMLRQQQTEGSENRGGSASQQGGDIAGGVGGLSPRQIGLDCLPGAGGSGGQGSDTEAPSSVEALILKKLHREGLSQWMLHEGGLRTSKANLLVLPSLEEMHSVDRNELIKALQQSGLITASNTSAPGVTLLQQSCRTLSGVLDFILQLGDVAGVPQPAALLVDQLRSRLRRQAAASCTVLLASSPGRTPRLPSSSAPSSSPPTSPPAPRLLILSGVAPFTQAGLWVPDMLSLLLPLTSPPRPSGSSSTAHLFRLEPGDAHRQISWEHIVSMAPDVLVIANDQSEELLSHMAHLAGLPGWWSLPAVVSGRVFLVQEGYLTRPGPRLIEGVELLAKILHPDLLPARRIQKASVLKLSLQGGQRCRQCLIPNYFIPWQ